MLFPEPVLIGVIPSFNTVSAYGLNKILACEKIPLPEIPWLMQSRIITFVSEWWVLMEVNNALPKLPPSAVEQDRLLQGAVVSRSLAGDNTIFFPAK